MANQNDFLSKQTLIRFEALQQALIPRSSSFTLSQRHDARALVNSLMAQQPSDAKRKLKVFLLIIDAYSLLRFGRSFRQLTGDSQQKVLRSFFDSPISLIRKGFWGLNTIVRLSVYGQESLHKDLGYTLKPNTQVSKEKGAQS